MAWAKDDRSMELVFIGQVPTEYTGLKCGCICYGCGQQVVAVNAGVQTFARTPHFRHRERVPGLTCSLALAKDLIARQLEGLAGIELELPARSVKISVRGLSGKEYSSQEVFPSEQVRVSVVQLTSHAQALVTFEDGRQVLVSLEGNFNAEERGLPTIVVRTDDPAIAALSPSELRQRIKVIIGAGTWQGPLFDQRYTDARRAQLEQEALEALDFIPEEAFAEIGRSPEPETLLHWTAKELLREIPRIAVPPIRIPFLAEYAKRGVTPRDCEVHGITLDLSDVRLEARLGKTRPDVQANAAGIPHDIWDGPLAIEIAVSNKVCPERARRIAAEGVASLEVDLSMTERSFSRTLLKRILTENAPQKHWVFHPGEATLAEALSAKMAAGGQAQQQDAGLLTITQRELAEKFEELFLEICDFTNGRPFPGVGQFSEAYHLAMAELIHISKGFDVRGFPPSQILSNPHLTHILRRLYWLKRDDSAGSAGKALEQILNDPSERKSRGYHHLYLLAIRTYQPKFIGFSGAEAQVSKWRSEVLEGFKNPVSHYFASYDYNHDLAHVLPTMANGLRWRPR